MAFAKKELFDKKLQQEADFFKALSHPLRLQILMHLAQTRTCLQGDTSDLFPLSRTTINQHLHDLRDARLIKCHEVEGKSVYCLNLELINEMRDVLSAFLKDITLPEDFCCEYNATKMGFIAVD